MNINEYLEDKDDVTKTIATFFHDKKGYTVKQIKEMYNHIDLRNDNSYKHMPKPRKNRNGTIHGGGFK